MGMPGLDLSKRIARPRGRCAAAARLGLHAWLPLVLVALLVHPTEAGCKPPHEERQSPPYWPDVKLTPERPQAEVYLTGEAECVVGLSLDRPSRVSLSIAQAERLAASDVTVDVRVVVEGGPRGDPGRPPSRSMLRQPGPAGTYDLYPGLYLLALRGTKPLVAPTQYSVSIARVEALPSPSFALRPGAAASFRLEQFSGQAFLSTTVATRSRVTLTVVPPAPVATAVKHLQVSALRSNMIDRYWPDGNDGLSFDFVLAPGSYTFNVDVPQSQWPRAPLGEPLLSSRLTLRVASVQSAAIPEMVRTLDDWLQSYHLDAAFVIVDLYDRARPDRSIRKSVQLSYLKRALYIGALQQLYRRPPPPGGDDAKFGRFLEAEAILEGQPAPSWLDLNDVPDYLLRLRTSLDRDQVRAIEHEFRRATGTSLWEVVLRKVATQTGRPVRRIAAWLPVSCSGEDIFEQAPGSIEREGSECTMGSAAKAFMLADESAIARPASLLVPLPRPDLGQVIDAFLRRFLPSDARVEYVDRSPESVDAVVRTIRGHVIPGGTAWERLQISFVLYSSEPSEYNLKVYVDGRVASGAGGYPPDSQFSKDMEPAHAEAVSTYTRRLASELADHLKSAIRR